MVFILFLRSTELSCDVYRHTAYRTEKWRNNKMSVIWYLWLELWCRKLSVIIFWSLILPTGGRGKLMQKRGMPRWPFWKQKAGNRAEWAPRQLSSEQVGWESIFGCVEWVLPRPSWARGCLHQWQQLWQTLNEEFGDWQWKITQTLCPSGNWILANKLFHRGQTLF